MTYCYLWGLLFRKSTDISNGVQAAYAEYARRGFAELIMVALINIGLLLYGLHLIRRTSAMSERIRKLSLSNFSMAKIYICVSITAFVVMNYANLDARIAANNIDRLWLCA